MTQTNTGTSGTVRLTYLIKSAYWFGLSIIAATAMVSYVLLQHMISEHQRTDSFLQVNASQMALSQRIAFLANSIGQLPADKQPALVGVMAQAVDEFEVNYETILEVLDEEAFKIAEGDSPAEVFYGAPYHLDNFSQKLIDNGKRLVSARRLAAQNSYLGDPARASLDETVATTTLTGYIELGTRIEALANERMAAILSLHRALFYGTIGAIVFVALCIFRPMTNLILRKTDELMNARNSMAYIAVHDGLTGLYNRAFLTDHFDTLLKSAHRRSERLAVIQFDLDRFKQINDTLGHAAGDLVLRITADRMTSACRASDICVRLGGDEFVMALNAAGTSDDINEVVQRVLARINEPVIFQGVTIMPGASAGIAVYPVDADNANDLLVHADLALYSAKKLGGGSASFFSEELRRELDRRKELEADIKTAIAEEQFEAYFQPQVSLSSGKITGIEALVRWRHPTRGLVSPAQFLPAAEKAGLMTKVGRMTIRNAIMSAGAWHRAQISFGRLAINVSGTELRENDFEDFLFDALDSSGLPIAKLSLEIVESVILDDEKTGIAAKLRRLRAAGVHLELDDFGTGYASLSHINPNEIDRLKIDRRFVQNINANDDNTKIVRAITELARGLGISIIAEGAETEEELSLLQAIGCDQVQGYSIAFPMPQAETEEWLRKRLPRTPKLTIVGGKTA